MPGVGDVQGASRVIECSASALLVLGGEHVLRTVTFTHSGLPCSLSPASLVTPVAAWFNHNPCHLHINIEHSALARLGCHAKIVEWHRG